MRPLRPAAAAEATMTIRRGRRYDVDFSISSVEQIHGAISRLTNPKTHKVPTLTSTLTGTQLKSCSESTTLGVLEAVKYSVEQNCPTMSHCRTLDNVCDGLTYR
jgi:hypothetical protein